MDIPKISVLLPVHNAAQTIQKSLQSILNQSFIDFEIILVENGSDDGSTSVLNSFSDRRIKIFHLENKGLVEALNFGLDKCQAPIIARMDADDISHVDRFKKQYNYLAQHPDVSLVSGLVNYCGDRKTNAGYVHYVNWANSILNHEDIYLTRFQESSLPHPSVMFRKELITKYGGYKPSVPEDFELWNRWLSHGVEMAKIENVILDWYDSPNRLSRNSNRYSQEAFSDVKAEYFSKWYKNKFNQKQPDLYIFGFSSTVKTKTKALGKYGLKIKSFLDVERSNSPQKIYYKDLEKIDNKFILSYVSDRQGKLEVKQYLQSIGMTEGENFYMME